MLALVESPSDNIAAFLEREEPPAPRRKSVGRFRPGTFHQHQHPNPTPFPHPTRFLLAGSISPAVTGREAVSRDST